jgi:apolipoprotein N-acyltransferase
MDSVASRILLPLSSAVLFFFGTGLAPVSALAWLAPLPVLLLARHVQAWLPAFLACFAGTANSWVFYSGSHDVPLLPWGLLISFGFGVTFALATWLFRALLARPLLAAVVAPAAWVSVLYVAAVSNPMGVVGTLATTQADLPVLLQTASVTGAWGIEFLVFFAAAAIATLQRRVMILLTGVAVVVLGGGALRLSSGPGPSERVALLASNQKGWAADLRTSTDLLNAYVAEIEALPAGVKTVVLPEAAFGGSAQVPAELDSLRAVAQARGFTIVVGYAQWTGTAKYNYALTFPEGSTYLKHHDTVSPPGDSLTFSGEMGIVICGDVNHRNPISAYAAAGAQIIAIPASNEDQNGWQHRRTALLRGAENGVAIAWSGRQTSLMLSDGYGRVLASRATGSDPSAFTTVIGDVPLGPGGTLYTRFGDWFAWLCLALTIAGLIIARKKPRTEAIGAGRAEHEHVAS